MFDKAATLEKIKFQKVSFFMQQLMYICNRAEVNRDPIIVSYVLCKLAITRQHVLLPQM